MISRYAIGTGNHRRETLGIVRQNGQAVVDIF